MCIRDRSILVSCGARLAPFDIAELRDVTAYEDVYKRQRKYSTTSTAREVRPYKPLTRRP